MARTTSPLIKTLRQAMKASGETDYAIAKGAGIDAAQLSRLRRGSTLTLASVEKIADHLGYSVELKRKGTR